MRPVHIFPHFLAFFLDSPGFFDIVRHFVLVESREGFPHTQICAWMNDKPSNKRDEMEDRPNVILIGIDCLRSDRLFGPDRSCKTPNIDKLVARGCSVPNVFVENSMTAPSFSSIFTGRYAGNHGVIGMVGVSLDEEVATMAEIFSASGYETYAEVTGPLNPILGVDRGFANYNFRSQHDYYFGDWGKKLLEDLKEKRFEAPYFLLTHFWEIHEPHQVRPDFDKPEFGATTYDKALSGLDRFIGEMIEAASENTAIVLTGDHGECLGEIPPEDTLLPYFLDKLDLPPVGEEVSKGIDDVTDLMAEEPRLHQFAADVSAASGDGTKKLGIWQRLVMMFNLLRIGMARYRIQLKKGVRGGFFANLKQKLNDIMLFFAVLRGKPEAAQLQLVRNSLEEHKLQHGYHIYDYLQNVPAVFTWPGTFPEGGRMEADVRHIDLLPTFVEAFKLDAPEDCLFDGASYHQYMLDGKGEDRPAFMEARGGAQAEKIFLIRGVRRRGRKIAFAPFEENAPSEFYDLKADTEERNNLAETAKEEAATLVDEANAIAASFAEGAGKKLSAKENAEMVKRLKSLGYM